MEECGKESDFELPSLLEAQAHLLSGRRAYAPWQYLANRNHAFILVFDSPISSMNHSFLAPLTYWDEMQSSRKLTALPTIFPFCPSSTVSPAPTLNSIPCISYAKSLAKRTPKWALSIRHSRAFFGKQNSIYYSPRQNVGTLCHTERGRWSINYWHRNESCICCHVFNYILGCPGYETGIFSKQNSASVVIHSSFVMFSIAMHRYPCIQTPHPSFMTPVLQTSGCETYQ